MAVKRRPLRPGSPEYMRRYGAGTGIAPYRPQPVLFRNPVSKPKPSPMRESPVRTTTPVAARTAPPPKPASMPWQQYLDYLNQQEQSVMDRSLESRRAAAKSYLEALTGFGQALQGSAAQNWGQIADAYGRNVGEISGYTGGLTDSYYQGLLNANQQIAQDFAAIGQGGQADIRDTQAAKEQVATVGNTRPAETLAAQGRAWGSYGETRPGTIGFMTEQNLMQATREALQAEDEIRNEFAQAMLDNPQQAMEMWGAIEQMKAAKDEGKAKAAQQKFENLLLQRKEAREAQAFELQVQQYNLSVGKEMADRANDLSKSSGTVWIYNPRTGLLQDTGRPTESSRSARARESNTAAANRERAAHNKVMEGISRSGINISRGNLAVAQDREARLNRPESKGGFSNSDKRQWGARAGTMARIGFQGERDPKDKKKWITEPMPVAQVLRDMLAEGIPYSIAYNAILRYARIPNSRWAVAKSWQKK